MEIKDFFTSKSFSEEEASKIASVFKMETVHKGQKILEPHNRGTKVYFVQEGLLRTYYLKDGKDITHHFFLENTFALPLESIFYNKVAPYGIESLETGIVVSAHYHEFERISEIYPSLQKMIRLLLIDVLHAFSERLYAIQFQTAQDRYKAIVDNHPDLLVRAPLGHIASYIGITQQTLSVLRAQR
ncbi:Crp/Fnr family transcriptional regulator [Dyadobacter sp. CY261]|uniref:Crp/Fnr family transcriptional regulator n=1 Tax=Dyadobacter sp. CY261 TaxID=2907203 RepID=UPI001F34F8C8|nr:Crp/Fnr family transcriptional regulator [Dyadobacter sp. CY261]MCF0069642.1 Crp/Fnr family transcriptional regulator [Dyadobacter sp. CY261]